MGENARLRGYRSLSIPQDIVLIPPPGSTGENGYLGGTMVSVSVFRHRRFQGLAHSRLSMEFARSLSLKLGRELSKNNHGIPACRSVFHEWQQEMGLSASQSENLVEILERSMGLPPLAAEWHEVRRRRLRDIDTCLTKSSWKKAGYGGAAGFGTRGRAGGWQERKGRSGGYRE